MKGENIVMSSSWFKGLLITVAGILTLSGAAWGHGNVCSNATLRGDYGGSITGEVLPPPPAPTILMGGVVMSHFDGKGNVTQSDFITLGGVPAVPNDEFRQGGVGTYTVNPDCTGSSTVATGPGSQITTKFVIVNQGDEILLVVSSLSPAPGVVLPARITSRAVRAHPGFPW